MENNLKNQILAIATQYLLTYMKEDNSLILFDINDNEVEDIFKAVCEEKDLTPSNIKEVINKALFELFVRDFFDNRDYEDISCEFEDYCNSNSCDNLMNITDLEYILDGEGVNDILEVGRTLEREGGDPDYFIYRGYGDISLYDKYDAEDVVKNEPRFFEELWKSEDPTTDDYLDYIDDFENAIHKALSVYMIMFREISYLQLVKGEEEITDEDIDEAVKKAESDDFDTIE